MSSRRWLLMAGAGKDIRSAMSGVSWDIIYEMAFIMRVVF